MLKLPFPTHCLPGVLQKLTDDVLKPTAQEVAEKLPGAAQRFNDNLKANTDDLVAQLQAQVGSALPAANASGMLCWKGRG